MSPLEYLRELWTQTPGPIRTFAIAVPSALFGAWLSGRAQLRRSTIEELKALNAAHALCFTIANKALGLKNQHVRGIKTAYDEATEAYEAYATNPVGVFEIQLDLQAVQKVTFPSAAIEKIIFEKVSIGGEGVATAVALVGALDDLKASLEYRADLVSEFRKSAEDPIKKRMAYYLGLVHDGQVDDRYRNSIDALSSHTDDCIFFAKRLSGIITSSENRLRRRRWHYLLPGEKIIEPNWSAAEEAGLIPPETDYAGWTKGFVKRPTRLSKLKGRVMDVLRTMRVTFNGRSWGP